jgi:hypothetical protein
MSQVFVVSSITVEQGADKEPRLAYASLASTANTITPSHDASNIAYVYDGMTTLKWRPANATSSIQFDGVFDDTDYCAISGANWASAGCTVTVKDSGGNTLGEASGLSDNQPVFFVFTKATYTTIKLEFSCSNALLEVGEVYFGESMLFPRNVAVGYQPGRWTSNDEITTSRTEGNQFSASTIRARGTSESFTINFVPTSYMETTYKTFMNAAKGRPVFFLWNKDNFNQAVFGYWNARRPTFTSSLFSSIAIEIDGVA